MRSIRNVVAALCAAILFGGIPSTASADTPVVPACSSVPFTHEVPLAYQDLWTYTFKITWCVQDGKIIWVEVEVTHEEHKNTCTWVGRVKGEKWKEPDVEAWTGFDMSKYFCKIGPGEFEVTGVTPWALVTVYPNGLAEEQGKGFE